MGPCFEGGLEWCDHEDAEFQSRGVEGEDLCDS